MQLAPPSPLPQPPVVPKPALLYSLTKPREVIRRMQLSKGQLMARLTEQPTRKEAEQPPLLPPQRTPPMPHAALPDWSKSERKSDTLLEEKKQAAETACSEPTKPTHQANGQKRKRARRRKKPSKAAAPSLPPMPSPKQASPLGKGKRGKATSATSASKRKEKRGKKRKKKRAGIYVPKPTRKPPPAKWPLHKRLK